MPVPKRKRSRQRRDKRFANKGLKVKAIAHCPQCKSPTPAHQVCSECGFYKGRKVIATKADKKIKKAAAAGKRASQQKAAEATEE
jgi:large subunit ribosomal protein L32